MTGLNSGFSPMVTTDHPIANVNDAFNAIYVSGNAVGNLMLYGRGAGDLPTGSAVLSDIISILRNNHAAAVSPHLKSCLYNKEVHQCSDAKAQHYIRLSVKDRPGALKNITAVFETNNVNIAAVHQDIQKLADDTTVVFITHSITKAILANTIQDLKNVADVSSVENVLRIENI